MKSRRSKATDISMGVKKKVWERDKKCCVICGNPQAMPNAHFISRAKGGLGIEENIVTLCYDCHNDFDNGEKVIRDSLREILRRHLKQHYPNWNEEELYYKKYEF